LRFKLSWMIRQKVTLRVLLLLKLHGDKHVLKSTRIHSQNAHSTMRLFNLLRFLREMIIRVSMRKIQLLQEEKLNKVSLKHHQKIKNIHGILQFAVQKKKFRIHPTKRVYRNILRWIGHLTSIVIHPKKLAKGIILERFWNSKN